jgi:PAS domain S-box-containing protein
MMSFKRIVAAPVFDDEIKTQQAYMLHIILWTLVCVPIPFIIYTFLFIPESSSRILSLAAFGETANIILLLMLRRGYVRSASILQASAFWLFFTFIAFTGNGVQGEAYLLGYVLVIVISGILLGGAGASVFTLLSIAAGGWMVYGQMRGINSFGFDSSPLTTWAVSIVLFPVGAILQYFASQHVQNTLYRARASEEKYRLISRVSTDYTFASDVDPQGGTKLVWVTGAFESMTGFTYEEYVATGEWPAHVHPDDRAKDALDMETLKNNQDLKSEIRTVAKNGEIRWERIFAHPIWNEKENRLIGIVGAVQDVTEQKRTEATLEYERDLLQIFMNNIPDSVYFKDIESRFIRINQTQAEFLGLESPQDAIGKTDLDFQSSELARRSMDEEKQIRESGLSVLNRIEFNPTSDGKPRWISATKVPVKDRSGLSIGIIGISRDVTEEKKAEELEQNRSLMLEKVVQLGKQAAKSDDLRTTIQKIWHGVHDDLGFDRLGIFLLNAEQVSLENTVGTNNAGEMIEYWHIPLSLPSSFAALLKNPNDVYFTPNYAQENNIPEDDEMYGVKEYVAVAAWAGDKPVAIICADHNITHRSIAAEQLEALRLFSGYAGFAIENARLNEKIQNELAQQIQAKEREEHRRGMLEKVISLGKLVTQAVDLRSTIEKIWHGVHDELGFDRTAIFLHNPDRNSMDDTIGTDLSGQMVDESGIWFPVNETDSFSHVLKKRDGMYFTHQYDLENNIPQDHEMYGVKDYVAVAAWAGDKPVAVLCADHNITHRPITAEQLEALRLFSGYAGLAIENVRLNEKIQNELAQQIQAKEREEHRRGMLGRVINLGQRVTEVQDLRTTLQQIWIGVHHDLGFDRLGIYLYNQERKSMDGTFGTNNQGEMIDEWHTWFSIEQDNQDSNSFLQVFERPNTIFLTHSFEKDYNIPPGHNMAGVQDHASIGAWAGEKPVAVISVDNVITGRPFTEEQLEALRLFAGYVGLAIENARLNELIQKELSQQIQAKEREEHRREILEKVVRLGQAVTEVYDLRTTLIRIWHGVHDGLGFDRLGIYLYNPKHFSMDGTFGTNNQGEMIDEWHTQVSMKQNDPAAKSFLHVLEKPDTIYLTHTYESDNKTPENHVMAGVKDFAAIAAWAGEKPVAVICVDHVITGRPITEEQLEGLRLFAGYAGLAIENARLNSALENELSQRKNFIVELEAKNAELERFTYTVSHDLKSPLVTIRGFLGYLERDSLEGDYEKFKHDKLRIETAVEKMQNLLQDLLELSRIGRLMNAPVEIPFEEIVKDALEIVHGQIEDRNVLIEHERSDITLKCDRIRMTEVLQNLIDNAVKFMGTQASPRIEIGTYLNSENENVFFVKDNGIGIAPEFHGKIFGLFDKLITESDGTGIGLALVKRIIELHGGRIWVESEIGKGAAFYFTIT